MAHAKPKDLEDLSFLLEQLRGIENLKEKSLGCFYLKGKGVLHFHTKDDRRYAHIFNGKLWEELDIKPNPSASLQKVLFNRIQKLLP